MKEDKDIEAALTLQTLANLEMVAAELARARAYLLLPAKCLCDCHTRNQQVAAPLGTAVGMLLRIGDCLGVTNEIEEIERKYYHSESHPPQEDDGT